MQKYYGSLLESTCDLQTSASSCSMSCHLPKSVREALSLVHPEVIKKYVSQSYRALMFALHEAFSAGLPQYVVYWYTQWFNVLPFPPDSLAVAFLSQRSLRAAESWTLAVARAETAMPSVNLWDQMGMWRGSTWRRSWWSHMLIWTMPETGFLYPLSI